jgi:hypothetical protein
MSVFGFEHTASLNSPPHGAPTPLNVASQHARSHLTSSTPTSEPPTIDSDLGRMNWLEIHPTGSAGPFDQTQHLQDATTSPRLASYVYTRFPNMFDSVPSPAGYSDFEHGGAGYAPNKTDMAHSSPPMPPPRVAGDGPSKRRKSEHSTGSPAVTSSDAYTPDTGPPKPYSPFFPPPLTPNSLTGTDDASPMDAKKQDEALYLPSDPRRLSVQSLISGPPAYHSNSDFGRGRQYPIVDSTFTTYGYDLGLPDYDSPRNNDHAAIAAFSPPSGTMYYDHYVPSGSLESRSKIFVFEKGGYYVEPVPIRIPRSLEPLPSLLQENPMNLLYFHHFINCTARVLVPHDCERNPFRHILPESESSATLVW